MNSFHSKVNLAAETKYGQSEEVYTEKVYNLSLLLARQAVESGCGVFVEFSTAQVYCFILS